MTANPAARRVRVMHFIESGGVYGAESVIMNLSREMRADNRFEPVIGCIVQDANERVALVDLAASNSIEAHRLLISNRLVWLHLPKIARRLRALKIDILHCHGYKPAVYAYVLAKLAGIRILTTCHLWYFDPDAPLKMRMMVRLEKLLYRRWPLVIAVSDKIRDTLLANGVKPEHVRVIPNGIPIGDYAARAGNAADPARPLRVLNVARLTQQKAQADLVTAAALVRRERADITFTIVGDGELREQLARQIESESLADGVELAGFRSDVTRVLQDADVFALPSHDEGMPISLLEAVAAGVPVIATAVGDVPKLIRDEDTGLIVAAGDPPGLARAILRVAADRGAALARAQRARQRLIDGYSSGAMYGGYARAYQEIAAAGAS
jgi:glycosyltransferase involved in cell wall biosynthesis